VNPDAFEGSHVQLTSFRSDNAANPDSNKVKEARSFASLCLKATLGEDSGGAEHTHRDMIWSIRFSILTLALKTQMSDLRTADRIDADQA